MDTIDARNKVSVPVKHLGRASEPDQDGLELSGPCGVVHSTVYAPDALVVPLQPVLGHRVEAESHPDWVCLLQPEAGSVPGVLVVQHQPPHQQGQVRVGVLAVQGAAVTCNKSWL